MKTVWFTLFVAFGLTACGSKLSGTGGSVSSESDKRSSVSLLAQANSSLVSNFSVEDGSKLAEAEKKALEFGQVGEVFFRTSKNERRSGKIIASSPFRVGKSNCRRLTYQLDREAKVRETDLTACRRPGTAWKLVL